MLYAEKIRKHKKGLIACMFFFSILVNSGFFPMVNFNPDSPVNPGITMRQLIICEALIFHIYAGLLETVLCFKWSVFFVAALNAALILSGLVCRYLLEFGEISNSHNFSIVNVSFHVIILALISTVVCVLARRKPIES